MAEKHQLQKGILILSLDRTTPTDWVQHCFPSLSPGGVSVCFQETIEAADI